MSEILGSPELMFWPGGPSPAIGNFGLNQATDALEFMFQSPTANPITRVGVRQGSVTGIAPTYKVSLQGHGTTGVPDGVIKGGATPASVTFTPVAGGNSTWQELTLANAYTPVLGEFLSCVIAYSSGTVDAGNSCSFSCFNSLIQNSGTPYPITNDNGVRSFSAASPTFAVGTASRVFFFPVASLSTGSFSSTTTPDEKALVLNIPIAVCSTYKISGVVYYGSPSVAGSYDIVLYDSDGTTVLQRTSVDGDYGTASGSKPFRLYFDDIPFTLNAGSNYYLSILPTVGSCSIQTIVVASAADMDAYGYGSGWGTSASRTDGGAWTSSSVTRYGLNPILSDITAPASGGGTVFVPSGGAFSHIREH